MWTIDEFFGPDGLLAQHLDGYEPRPSQVDYAKWCDYTVSNKQHLIAEGNTGLGKSIGYLSSCIRHCVENNKVACIATANIALQEQLINKDLPFLRDVAGRAFKFALAKGRSNYLCKRQLSNFRAEHIIVATPFDRRSYNFEEDVNEILEWADRTKTGDRSELTVEPSPQNWVKFSVSADDCVGEKCEFKDKCYANQAKRRLKEVDIVVANYHLLFAHISVLMSSDGYASILPEFNILVCDEGHEMADIARAWFGWEVSEGAIRRLLNRFSRYRGRAKKIVSNTPEKDRVNLPISGAELRGMSDLSARVEEISRELFAEARLFHTAQEKNRKNAVIKRPEFFDTDPLQCQLSNLESALKKLSKMFFGDLKEEVWKTAGRASMIASQLAEMAFLKDSSAVYFVEMSGKRKWVNFVKRKIVVSEILKEEVFDKVDTVIVTSATLRTEGSFEFVRSDIGMIDANEYWGPSPFDYLNQCLLVTPLEALDPTKDGAAERMCELVLKTIQQASGRTLGLFTSYQKLKMAREYLDKHLNGDYEVFCQGDLPRSLLAKKFKQDTRSILLGTDSFWTGIDVPGEACSCVIMDKLPFPSPADPVIEALTNRESHPGDRTRGWRKVQLPRAILKFRQGFGRLIRKATDRGVVVLLDGRFNDKSKRYINAFLQSLPMTYRSHTLNCDDISEFLGRI